MFKIVFISVFCDVSFWCSFGDWCNLNGSKIIFTLTVGIGTVALSYKTR